MYVGLDDPKCWVRVIERLGFMSGLTLPTSVARERHWKPTPVSPLVLAAGKVNPDINPKLFPNTNRNPKV